VQDAASKAEQQQHSALVAENSSLREHLVKQSALIRQQDQLRQMRQEMLVTLKQEKDQDTQQLQQQAAKLQQQAAELQVGSRSYSMG
jgi:hypothetical protein